MHPEHVDASSLPSPHPFVTFGGRPNHANMELIEKKGHLGNSGACTYIKCQNLGDLDKECREEIEDPESTHDVKHHKEDLDTWIFFT